MLLLDAEAVDTEATLQTLNVLLKHQADIDKVAAELADGKVG